jgi:hypothetical protein
MSAVLPYAFLPASNPSSSPTMSNSSVTGSASAASIAGGSAVGSVPNLPSGALGSTLEALRTLVGKRITAWTYLKNAGEGRVYWFNVSLEPFAMRLEGHFTDTPVARLFSSRPKT